MNDAVLAIAPSTPRLTPCGEYFRRLNHPCRVDEGHHCRTPSKRFRKVSVCGSCETFDVDDFGCVESPRPDKSFTEMLVDDERVDGRVRAFAWCSMVVVGLYQNLVTSLAHAWKLSRGYSYCDNLP